MGVFQGEYFLFKMENFKGGEIHQPKTLYDIKNPPKNRAKYNYEDREDQVGYDTEENLRLAKIFNKSARKLDMRFRNNVTKNVQDNQHHNFNRCNF